MKRIRKGLAFAAVSAFLALLSWGVHMLTNASSLSAERDLSKLTTHRSYWLESGDLLTFSLEAGRTKFRLLTNAGLNRNSVGGDLHYSLSYRILDARGRELRAADYYLRLHTSRRANQQKRSFQARSATPSDTNRFYLDLAKEAGASTLELRMGPSSVPLVGISVRPYYQEMRPPERLDRIWDRLHESKRELLAEPNVLGVEFLTDLEARSLVSTFWHPAVPRGIEGFDYETALLIDEPVERHLTGSVQVADRWFLPAGRSASLGLSDPTELLVTASSVSGAAQPGDLRVFWSGRLQHERAELVLESNGPGLKSSAPLGRGIVTFEAETDLWLETADSVRGRPLRPQPDVVRAYNVGKIPVQVPVRHLPSLATPIRLDVRLEPGIASAQLEVSFVRGDHDETTRLLEVSANASRRDWLVRRGHRAPISDRHSVYLDVPVGVTELRLASRSDLWVSAYNRPPRLTQRVLIPESLFGGNEETRRYPRWFVLAPHNARTLATSDASALVQVALKPPEPEAQSRELAFSERLFPQQRWQGISVLTRNDPRRKISPSALGHTYQMLGRGEQLIRLVSVPATGTVRPTLLFTQADGEKGHLVIDADGTRLVDREVTTPRGRIELPELPGGAQRWRVTTSDSMALYLSNLEVSSPSYREQSLQTITTRAFRYQLQRSGSGRELLAFRVFSAEPGRVRLRVEFDEWQRDGAQQSDWTMASVDYDLLLEETDSVVALAPGVDGLGYEARAFHPVGADLPAGVHNLTVDVTGQQRSSAQDARQLFLGVTRSGIGFGDDSTLRIRRFEVSSR